MRLSTEDRFRRCEMACKSAFCPGFDPPTFESLFHQVDHSLSIYLSALVFYTLLFLTKLRIYPIFVTFPLCILHLYPLDTCLGKIEIIIYNNLFNEVL
ncbi:CD-NTase-associated protein [Trichinella pseudospiralis]